MPFFGSGEAQIPRHIPLPTGPHAVGFQDVMTPGGPEKGVFSRIYYPSIYPVNETINKTEMWPVWADDEYLVGFVKFMQAALARWPSWVPRGEYMYIDQISVIAPLLHIGCTQVWKFLNGTVYCPILKNAQISKEKKWPVIVFSHGLGCSRFAYSRICTDLASHGFIVIAPEHREGSSCVSYHHNEGGQKQFIHHRRLQEFEKEYEIRNEQVKHRAQEMLRCLELITDLNAGNKVMNELDANCVENLSMFKDQADMTSPVAAGHSFGGATTLLALQHEKRFKVGLVLDAWLFSLKDEALEPEQPIIFINTESFLNRNNISKMREFLTHPENRRMVFIKGSVHHNHLDTPFIFKSVTIKKITGMHSETDHATVMELNNKLMIHFINSKLTRERDLAMETFLEHHESVIIEATDKKIEEEEN